MPSKRVRKPKLIKPPKTAAQSLAAQKAQDYRRRHIFNICSEEYEAVLMAQGGGCRITGKTDNLAIDHDHDTGLLRGIIHVWVNKGIKYFNDDPAMLRRAADHLERSSFTETLGEPVYGVIGSVGKKLTKVQKKKGQTKIAWKYGPDGTPEPKPRTTALYIQNTPRLRNTPQTKPKRTTKPKKSTGPKTSGT